jgi:hypothetical protein
MKEFEDALLELSWNNFQTENQRYKEIDDKATNIITICAALISFLIAFRPEGSSDVFFLFVVLSFLVTVILSVRVLRTRKTETVSTERLIKDFKKSEPSQQIRGIITTIGTAEKNLRDVCNKKTNEMSKAITVLVFSVIVLSVYAASTITV